MNSSVIIALDFFEKVNGFEEDVETGRPGQKQNERQHTFVFAPQKPKAMPNPTARPSPALKRRPGGHYTPPATARAEP
jgi:hypothetical protein